MLLSLDQEKAFDHVDWGFLRSTHVHIGFGTSFVSWVDLFNSEVQTEGEWPFASLLQIVSRGPSGLLPLLNVLYVEVLQAVAKRLRHSVEISPLPPKTLFPDRKRSRNAPHVLCYVFMSLFYQL